MDDFLPKYVRRQIDFMNQIAKQIHYDDILRMNPALTAAAKCENILHQYDHLSQIYNMYQIPQSPIYDWIARQQQLTQQIMPYSEMILKYSLSETDSDKFKKLTGDLINQLKKTEVPSEYTDAKTDVETMISTKEKLTLDKVLLIAYFAVRVTLAVFGSDTISINVDVNVNIYQQNIEQMTEIEEHNINLAIESAMQKK